MTILDKAQVGNTVKVNIELSKDRLGKEIIDTLKKSSIGIISDFRITDGKGIGVILRLSDGKEQWFFEDEINLLDENGNVIEKEIDKDENHNIIFELIENMKYENKKNISDLLNPINFTAWLIVSLKDII